MVTEILICALCWAQSPMNKVEDCVPQMKEIYGDPDAPDFLNGVLTNIDCTDHVAESAIEGRAPSNMLY